MFVTGYSEQLSIQPGDDFEIRLSSDVQDLRCEVVRLWHGDNNPLGPGFQEELVEQIPAQKVQGTERAIGQGSAVRASLDWQETGAPLRVSALVWPTLPGNEKIQTILGARGSEAFLFKIFLDGAGRVSAQYGNATVTVDLPLAARNWYRIGAEITDSSISLAVQPLNPLNGGEAETHATHSAGSVTELAEITIGGERVIPVELSHGVIAAFNGKIENPRIIAGETVIADWRFEQDSHTSTVRDASSNGHHGHVVNMPARGMTGHNWSGEFQSPAQAPEQYGAIHFHEDDLVDAGWPVTASFTIIDTLKSGIYAVRVTATDPNGDTEIDRIPFVVRPAASAARPKSVFLLPTFTYTAYANERLVNLIDYNESGRSGYPVTLHPQDRFLAEHLEFGSSLYDQHTDGSGVCYSSLRRPVPNLRPDYRMWLQNAPRHLAADLYVTAFCRRLGIEIDVITDHDLHREGPAILDEYEAVLTGSHPEYYSGRMLDALQTHVDSGGSLAYLGGNGFYWVTSQDPERDYVCEVRRSQGIRSWETQPGENHHSSTGEPGGLWRFRGRSPNKLVGVGMASQGWDEKAPGYKRSPESYDPANKWVFEGIGDEIIGDFGLIMNGACGDEVDRYDVSLGSPLNAVVLATSLTHSNFYQPAVEDVAMLAPGLGGADNPDVRADMVLIEHPAGGAVFSTGAISFTGSLPWNNWDNNVSRLLENVVRNLQNRNTKNHTQVPQ